MAGGIGKKEAERIVADPPVEEVIHNDLEMVERLARLTAIGATDSRWDTQTKRTVLVILLVDSAIDRIESLRRQWHCLFAFYLV